MKFFENIKIIQLFIELSKITKILVKQFDKKPNIQLN